MNRFWDLMEKSTIVSGILATMTMSIAGYCTVNQIEMPGYFVMAFGAVMAYFFSEKVRGAEVRRKEGTGPLK